MTEQTRRTPACLPAVLLLPAMGVPTAYYSPLVEQLGHYGCAVTLVDFDRTGRRSSAGVRDGYAELVESRISSGFRHAAESTPTGQVVLLGHSLGGQLALIFAGRYAPDAPVILIGSGSAHFRGFSTPRNWAYLIASQTIAGLASLIGSWPGHKLGFGGRQTTRTMRDWARNVRTGRYDSRDASFDYNGALRAFHGPLAVVDVEGDVLAPPSATVHLTGMTDAIISRRKSYLPQRGRRRPGAHFTWARDEPGIAPQIIEWLSEPSFAGCRSEETKES